VTVRNVAVPIEAQVSVARSLLKPRWRLMSPSLKCVVTLVTTDAQLLRAFPKLTLSLADAVL
jgi:hypothetical protein